MASLIRESHRHAPLIGSAMHAWPAMSCGAHMDLSQGVSKCTVVLGLITQWIPTVDPCVLVKVSLLIPTVG
eukprot:COSAG01_NODE_882_length_12931_cov_668.084788_1_plen_71_part_00